MAGENLFGELPEQAKLGADTAPLGVPRLRQPKRDQIELRAVDIESLIGDDHRVRAIWAYGEGLELRELEDRIKARDERPGHPATSPRLLLALWLYATSEGVGSARALERLCNSHDAYRWLCGGLSVNYPMLADFRVGCADLLDRLFTEHLAAQGTVQTSLDLRMHSCPLAQLGSAAIARSWHRKGARRSTPSPTTFCKAIASPAHSAHHSFQSADGGSVW